MKTLLAPLALVFTTACATAGPLSFTTTSPTQIDASFACVTRKLNELNYTVTNANKDAGFITGEHQTSGIATQVIFNRKFHDVITVSIFDDVGGAQRKIRATAGQSLEVAGLFGGASKTISAPSESGIADAKKVLSACGTGQVMGLRNSHFVSMEVRAAQ